MKNTITSLPFFLPFDSSLLNDAGDMDQPLLIRNKYLALFFNPTTINRSMLNLHLPLTQFHELIICHLVLHILYHLLLCVFLFPQQQFLNHLVLWIAAHPTIRSGMFLTSTPILILILFLFLFLAYRSAHFHNQVPSYSPLSIQKCFHEIEFIKIKSYKLIDV